MKKNKSITTSWMEASEFTRGHGSIEGEDEHPLHRWVLHVVAVVDGLGFFKQLVTGLFNL